MILDVPYQSQEPLEKNDEKDWCALASLWMVMTFHLKSRAPSLEELHQKYGPTLETTETFQDIGITHKDLLKIARDFRLLGFRKSWWAEPGVQTLIEKFRGEGEGDKEINSWTVTNISESFYSLEELINHNTPVIISVSSEFSPSKTSHVVVLVGIEENQLIIHDPYKKGANFKISKEEFKKYWLRQAIIIYPGQ